MALCTVYFKGEKNPKNENLVKITLIIYKPPFPRVERLLPVTGDYKDWDNKTRSFKGNSEESIHLNQLLSEHQKKYLKRAAEWDIEYPTWEPVNLARSFETPVSLGEVERKVMTIAQVYDLLIKRYENESYVRNHEEKTRAGYGQRLRYNKNLLTRFVRERFGRDFNTMFFKEIDESFLKALVFYIETKAMQNGNGGAMHDKLFLLYRVIEEAETQRVVGAWKEVMFCVSDKYKTKLTIPRTIPYDHFMQIEYFDRSLLSQEESRWLDYYLFCFYCGGMAPIDAFYLRYSSIELKTRAMSFERMKTGVIARPIFHPKAEEIANRYKHECFGEYVLPIFSAKHNTPKQKKNRAVYVQNQVNKTLARISQMLGFEEDVKFYSCRGTYITRMLDLGVHPMVIAEHCGHSPEMIYKYYFKNTKFDEVKNTVLSGI